MDHVLNFPCLQTGHCAPIPRLLTYKDACPSPKRISPTTDKEVENSAPALVKMDSPNDPTYGTTDNADACQHSLQDVPRLYLTVCPGGGAPVPKFGQCGGLDYAGPTCCYGYAVCVEVLLLRRHVFAEACL
jgi:hypothetical protein